MDKLYESDNPNYKFIKGYLIYVGILCAIFLGVIGYLCFRLYKYQKNTELEAEQQTEEAEEDSYEDEEKDAQRCFTDYIDSLGINGWVNVYFNDHPERLDSEETVNEFLTEKIMNSGYSCYKAADFSLEAPEYVVMADGETLAEVILSKNGDNWEVSKADVLLTGDNSVTVKAPADSKVYINGHELLEDSVTVNKQAATLEDYDDDLENPIIFNEYVIDGMISDTADIQTEDGSLIYNDCDDTYYEAVTDSESSRDKAEQFVKALLHYYASGKENTEANQSEVLSYVAGSSNASKVIYAAASGLEWVTADYSLSYTTSTQKPLKIADNAYFVDVNYDLEGGRNNSSSDDKDDSDAESEDTDAEDAADGDDGSEGDSSDADGEETADDNSHGVYRVYFLDTGDGYRIVEFAGVK